MAETIMDEGPPMRRRLMGEDTELQALLATIPTISQVTDPASLELNHRLLWQVLTMAR
jgi:hypothetical protein